MKILLVEDEPRVSSFIKKGLDEQGHNVTPAYDGVMGLKLATSDTFDVIILDIVMPGLNGIELCQQLRDKHNITTPILMLTALGSTDDVVTGLETGADDYLTKPFKFKELLARIGALSRRGARSQNNKSELLKVQDLKMNVTSKEVFRDGREIVLTAREFELLEYLLKNKNRVVSRTRILENVWGVDYDLGTNVVDVYINYLRKKVEAGFPGKIIKTVIGMGYIIKD
ncbi:MAG: DNA-binding response regulator [Crocinitomicaceae bacterium]|nr:DNA-binding response regulator [Crocinitomicaceae bacterium]|tara:strand:+ start:3778 stop:4458 length:681 start_codon:yes stop_codon:yes gene_type:complete